MSGEVDELRGKLALERAEVRRLRERLAALEAHVVPDPAEGDRLRGRMADLENQLRNAKEALECGKTSWGLERSTLEAKAFIVRQQAVDYLRMVYSSPPASEERLLAEHNTKMLKALMLMAGPRDEVIDKVLPPDVAKAVQDFNAAWDAQDAELAREAERRLNAKFARLYPQFYADRRKR